MSYEASAGARAIAPAVPLSELPDSKDTPTGRKTLPFRPAPDRVAETADLWGRGFSLIPVHVPVPGGCSCGTPACGSPGKHPAIKWEQYQAERPTQDDVHSWFGNGTRRNVGIVTGAVSGIVVVDLDSAEAESWAAANLPTTPMQVQTAKGRHLYYQHPGVPVSNKARIDAGDPAVKIDVRGDGGFVVGPGSQHASGARYERLGEWPAVDQLPVFEPAWLTMTAPARKTMPATAGHGIPEGERNAALATRAGQLRRIGLSQGAMAGALLVENAERCIPPLPDGEVKAIAASVGKYEAAGAPADAPRGFTLIRANDLMTRPNPPFLVADRIIAGTLGVIWGEPGCCKTFVMLDCALSVATGRPWLGADVVSPGAVVYVVAEGGGGFGARIRAWLTTHEVDANDPINLYIVETAVNLMEPESVDQFMAAVAEVRPSLIVLDTLARCMAGGDENTAKDIGRVVHECDRIIRATGASVYLVHHSTKSGNTERGSSALRGGCHTMMSMSKADDLLTLGCDKQKDGVPEFAPVPLSLVPVSDTSSCVVRPASQVLPKTGLTSEEHKALNVLSNSFMADGATTAEWLTVSRMPSTSFYRARKRLEQQGLIAIRGQRNVWTGTAPNLSR